MGRIRPKAVPAQPAGKEAWQAMEASAVLSRLDVSVTGLSDAEARQRLQRFGANVLPHKPPPTLLEILLRQFRSPLIYLLALAALVSLFLDEYQDAVFICIVLVINAIIGAVQETKAEKAGRGLQKLLRIRASVRRDGLIREISAEAIVPGDIVCLESGQRVPADLRLLDARGLEVDESLLTGESLVVAKNPAWVGTETTPLADQLNMLRAGTSVARGRCQGVVVATGTASAIGELALDVMHETAGRPPLLDRMERFTRKLALLVIAACTILAVFGVLFGGYDINEMFLFGVALAVSAVPEGLPVALTVALAIGTTRMARRGVIIRRLAAVEGLGSCTLIASDKTGTLTCNELTVREVRLPGGRTYTVSGEGFIPEGRVFLDGKALDRGGEPALDRLVRAAVLCNEAELRQEYGGWTWRGDPTEVALLAMARKLGWNREATLACCPQVNLIAFEPERQFAASYHRQGDETIIVVKGAPERVLEMLTADEATGERLRGIAAAMAEAGFRVLAVAEGPVPVDPGLDRTPPQPAGLECLGFIGMIDPLRPGVAAAVQQAMDAGVRTIMITGDHPVTALAIAKNLNLAEHMGQVVTGAQVSQADAQALEEMLSSARVFARVTPRQKLQIVVAARAAGHFVAVTGDGVNDAPALRAANIGVAMGKSGTDVAREAAELVISDDHFGTITAGIEEGRIAYDNIRNVVYLATSTGAAEVVLVALALITGLPIPLLPVQLLWLNLVTNGIQDVALAFEPGATDVLRRKPRPPGEAIFNRLMVERTVLAAAVMGGTAFMLFGELLAMGWTEDEARNSVLLLMVLFENVHLFNCRSELNSAFSRSPFKSPMLLLGVLAALSLHIVMMHQALGNTLLAAQAIPAGHWLLLLSLTLPIVLLMELHKLHWKRRQH